MHRLLERLEKVRQAGPRRWYACCPAHEDRHPSLAITEAEEGRVLLFCNAGFGALDVIRAAGLEPRDLFPPDEREAAPRRRGQRHDPRQLLRAAAQELTVIVVAAEAVQRGERLQGADLDRLATAGQRVRTAAREAGANV
ncbi:MULTISPECIES: hypothetical protein [Halorhodospira]|uniref:hypothetical protein n=1 Tax=Halorhodospira TaxID=85108 RepID=UPI001EE933BB|nr:MULTISPECIES: hypothetical protein [Halorhodospira]MCG5528592.1 hypothetical protein [Halorhodospira halophila]MCG5543745.1 hypothetical protein [Halorhodospira sp. 9628]